MNSIWSEQHDTNSLSQTLVYVNARYNSYTYRCALLGHFSTLSTIHTNVTRNFTRISVIRYTPLTVYPAFSLYVLYKYRRKICKILRSSLCGQNAPPPPKSLPRGCEFQNWGRGLYRNHNNAFSLCPPPHSVKVDKIFKDQIHFHWIAILALPKGLNP